MQLLTAAGMAVPLVVQAGADYTVSGRRALPIIMRIAGALLLAYFISRLTLRVPNRWRRFQGLFYSHFLAWLICCLIIFAARWPLGVFSLRQTGVLAAAQIVWLSVDQLRRNYPERRLSRR